MAGQKLPNILVIFGDDIGYWNISSYGGDCMGVPTPNIDRSSTRQRSRETRTSLHPMRMTFIAQTETIGWV
jgi:hypothetical protein